MEVHHGVIINRCDHGSEGKLERRETRVEDEPPVEGKTNRSRADYRENALEKNSFRGDESAGPIMRPIHDAMLPWLVVGAMSDLRGRLHTNSFELPPEKVDELILTEYETSTSCRTPHQISANFHREASART